MGLEDWFSSRGDFVPKRYLVMSGDISVARSWEGVMLEFSGWGPEKDAPKHPKMQKSISDV